MKKSVILSLIFLSYISGVICLVATLLLAEPYLGYWPTFWTAFVGLAAFVTLGAIIEVKTRVLVFGTLMDPLGDFG